MRVRIAKSIAGDGFAYQRGQVVEIDDDLARKWLASGVAEPIRDEPVFETATAEPNGKRATLPRPRRRKS